MINISGAPPNSLAGGPPEPPYYDNYSGPANPACFLTLDDKNDWAGQSFTTNKAYNLGVVELWIKKNPGDDVGDVEVAIYPVDGEGHPFGQCLGIGRIPNADVSEEFGWVSCTLDYLKLTVPLLRAATKYCVVVHGPGLSVLNALIWSCGGDGSDFPNGDQEWSDGALNGPWFTDTTRDQLFRCYPTEFLDNYSGTAHAFLAGLIDHPSKWAGQSFTAMKSYSLSRIDVRIEKRGFVGDIIVALYDVDEFGHPDIMAGHLATGIIPDADISESSGFVRCDLACNISAGKKYCIVVHGYSLNAGNKIYWAYDDFASGSDYEGGDREWSTDSGGAWVTFTDSDYLFRCYAE